MSSGKNGETKKYIFFLLKMAAAAALIAADRLICAAAEKGLKGREPVTVIKNIIGLRYAENTGAAWSFMSEHTEILSAVTLILLICGIIALFLDKIPGKILNTAAVMIIAGGTSNLIDRISKGYVVDYIETLFINFPIYNFADMLVTVGVFTVCAYLIYDMIREEKEKKRQEKENGEH